MTGEGRHIYIYIGLMTCNKACSNTMLVYTHPFVALYVPYTGYARVKGLKVRCIKVSSSYIAIVQISCT